MPEQYQGLSVTIPMRTVDEMYRLVINAMHPPILYTGDIEDMHEQAKKAREGYLKELVELINGIRGN